jgi:CheY-like chemotaxis protein
MAVDVRSEKYSLKRVLVVDDSHLMLMAVSHMAEALGFKADSATGGLAALRNSTQFSYDLLITDLQMQDFDGYALAGMLKQKTRQIKAIIMTGCAQSEVINYMNTGVVDSWLYKPFRLQDLGEMLSTLFPTDILLLPYRR